MVFGGNLLSDSAMQSLLGFCQQFADYVCRLY